MDLCLVDRIDYLGSLGSSVTGSLMDTDKVT